MDVSVFREALGEKKFVSLRQISQFHQLVFLIFSKVFSVLAFCWLDPNVEIIEDNEIKLTPEKLYFLVSCAIFIFFPFVDTQRL